MKKFLALLMAVAMVFSLAACGSKAEEAAPAVEAEDGQIVIKIGCTGPLTGPAAIYGQAVKTGAEIAVEEFNNLAGSTFKFEFKMEDDTHDPEKAENAYNALVDWGMDVMMGTVTSAPAEVTAADAFADRYFYLTPSASSTNVTDGKDCVFQMCFSDPGQGTGSAQYIYEHKLGTKIAIIWKNDDSYSTGIRNTFVEKAAELGLEIVDEETFTDSTSTDFSVQLQKIQAAGADLVFLPMYYTPASLIFNQAAAMNFAPLWFGVDGMDGILALEGFDTALAEGVIVLTPYSADADTPDNKAFVEAYTAKMNGEIPNQFAADAYDCIYAIYKVLDQAGITADMDHTAICEAAMKSITSITFDGLTGTNTTWDATGSVSKSPNAVVIQNGAYVGL